MFKVYGFRFSGNNYKVKLVMHRLGLQYEWSDVNIRAGEQNDPAFRAKNPQGKTPVLELPDGTLLTESNAILHYLADGTPLLPDERLARAQVLRWMFFEQASVFPNLAYARVIVQVAGKPDDRLDELKTLQQRGYPALDVMEGHLDGRTFFVDERYTLADIALFAYTSVGEEGEYDMSKYPRINAWLDRVRQQDGFVAMG